MTGVDFAVDVTLESRAEDHRRVRRRSLRGARGCLSARRRDTAMRPVDRAVRRRADDELGLSARPEPLSGGQGHVGGGAGRQAGGTIVCAAECRDGLPDHGSYGETARLAADAGGAAAR